PERRGTHRNYPRIARHRIEGAMSGSIMRTLLAPWWAAQLLTGAKSFLDNPLIGSNRLNRHGLHVRRVNFARAMTERRRRLLAAAVESADLAAFERDGYIAKRDFLPPGVFAAL